MRCTSSKNIYPKNTPLNMLFFLIFFCGSFSACAQTRPAWVLEPEMTCEEGFLCVVGSGESLNLAKTDAKSEIAKLFETKIQNNFRAVMTQNGVKSKSYVFEEATEFAQDTLKNVVIKETFQDNRTFYARAILNKKVYAQDVLDQIKKLDQKMKFFLEKPTPATALQMEQLFEQRDALNRRYYIVANASVPEQISLKQVLENKEKLVGKHRLTLDVQGKNSEDVDMIVRNALINNGYLLLNKSDTATPVRITFETESRYQNIAGFVKYAFHFKMSVQEKSGKIKDILTTTFEETGRTFDQACTNALVSLQSYLTEKIPLINF